MTSLSTTNVSFYVPPHLRKQNTSNINPRNSFSSKVHTTNQTNKTQSQTQIQISGQEQKDDKYYKCELNSQKITLFGLNKMKEEVSKLNKFKNELNVFKKLVETVNNYDFSNKKTIKELEKKTKINFNDDKNIIQKAKDIHFSGNRKDFINLCMSISNHIESLKSLQEMNNKLNAINNELLHPHTLILRYTELGHVVIKKQEDWHIFNEITQYKIPCNKEFVVLYCKKEYDNVKSKYKDLNDKLSKIEKITEKNKYEFVTKIVSILFQIEQDTQNNYVIEYSTIDENNNLEEDEDEADVEYDDEYDKYITYNDY